MIIHGDYWQNIAHVSVDDMYCQVGLPGRNFFGSYLGHFGILGTWNLKPYPVSYGVHFCLSVTATFSCNIMQTSSTFQDFPGISWPRLYSFVCCLFQFILPQRQVSLWPDSRFSSRPQRKWPLSLRDDPWNCVGTWGLDLRTRRVASSGGPRCPKPRPVQTRSSQFWDVTRGNLGWIGWGKTMQSGWGNHMKWQCYAEFCSTPWCL